MDFLYCGACVWQGRVTRVTPWYFTKQGAQDEIAQMAYGMIILRRIMYGSDAIQGKVFVLRKAHTRALEVRDD